jgi:hypothetical protein
LAPHGWVSCSRMVCLHPGCPGSASETRCGRFLSNTTMQCNANAWHISYEQSKTTHKNLNTNLMCHTKCLILRISFNMQVLATLNNKLKWSIHSFSYHIH